MVAAYAAKQNQIYENHFRAVMPSLPLVKTTKYVSEPDAGYFAVWLYPDSVMAKAANFNRQINEIVPVFRFDETNLHTTITVYQSQPQDTFNPNEDILHTLADICENLDSTLLQAVQVDFTEWLFNEKAVIAAGQANDAFWQVGEELQAAGAKDGHRWRMPWGAHLTVARFLKSSNKMNDLRTLVKQSKAPGLCQPKAIMIGHFKCGPSRLQFTPFAMRKIGE